MPRFHLPLIEPDVQFSRIRLSDQNSGFRLVKPSPQFIDRALAQYLREVLVGGSVFPLNPGCHTWHTATCGADTGRDGPRSGRPSARSLSQRSSPYAVVQRIEAIAWRSLRFGL